MVATMNVEKMTRTIKNRGYGNGDGDEQKDDNYVVGCLE